LSPLPNGGGLWYLSVYSRFVSCDCRRREIETDGGDTMYRKLFSEIEVGGIRLKNRLIMAPLYLGYAAEGGAVSRMLLEHYRLMAGSGVAMVVVENAAVDYPGGSGSTRTLRVDADDCLDGLGQLSEIIRKEGALSCLQINHPQKNRRRLQRGFPPPGSPTSRSWAGPMNRLFCPISSRSPKTQDTCSAWRRP